MDNVSWVKKRKQVIKLALAVLGAVCLFLGFATHTMGKRKRVNIEARKLFDNWVSVSGQKGADQTMALKQLNKLLKKHPYLQKNYDSQIAQSLITAGNSFGLDLFAKRATNHIENPLLKTYSLASCDIASNNMAQALERSLQLKTDLTDSFNSGSELDLLSQHMHLFNLYRIAVLFEVLGDKEKSIDHYLALKKELDNGRKDLVLRKGVDSFVHAFNQNEFSFDDYLRLKLAN